MRPYLLLRAARLIAFATILTPASSPAQEDEEVIVFQGANSRPTYFSVHNLAAAHTLASGRGVRVGILDHSFGMDAHPTLYAGGENFLEGRWAETLRGVSWHGYWMASTLREIAPDAQIFALNTGSPDDATRAAAMVRAIDWAIANRLHILTYSGRAFPAGVRVSLDSAVARAHAAGIVTTFIHYPHPGNLLPGWIGPRTGDDGREPDVNILQYDYSVLFADRYRALQRGEPARGYQPFLSISSTSMVTAGIVALVREVGPRMSPEEIRRLLVGTSRSMTLEGRTGTHVVDAHAAVLSAR